MAALGARTDSSTMTRVCLTTLGSMVEAVAMQDATARFQSRGGRYAEINATIKRTAISGEPGKLKTAMETSDSLIDAAIAHDQRLARRPQWTRGDDGIWADAGLVASGDDSPCFGMTRQAFRDTAASGDPVNIVISTDSSDPASLAAFIAAVRIVQQFRPVNVWWQGAWLADDGRNAGYVFLAPLVQNDMDFSRVQFVIESGHRDSLSFGVLHDVAVVRDRMRILGLGRQAEYSYMPDAHFVNHKGVRETPDAIARAAAMWLGWESVGYLEYEREQASRAALQRIPDPPAPPRDWPSEASNYWEEQDRKRRERSIAAAAERMNAIE
jgi:hypothetical protein